QQLVLLSQHSMERIVSGYIKLVSKSPENIIPRELNQSVHQLLKGYQKKLAASLSFNERNQFTLVGTHSLLTYLTNNLRSLPLVKDIQNVLPDDIAVHVGFGYGLTADDSEKNAR